MQDRLDQLRQLAPEEAPADDFDVEEGSKGRKKKHNDNDNDDASPEADPNASPFMADFFLEVGAVKEVMGTIRHNIGKLQEYAQEAVVSVDKEEEASKRSQEMQELISTSNNLAGQVRQRLEGMKKGNQQYQFSKDATPTEIRIRSNMHNTLVTKFMELMKEYNQAQTEYQRSATEKLSRQCKIVKPDMTEEEVKDVIDSGNTQIFTDAIRDKDLHAAAKQALSYIENKHSDIVRLNQSIQELHQLFLDMSTLVQCQGEMVDQIEYNCSKADEFMVDAVNELRKTGKLQRGNRKKMCCILIFATIVLIIIIAPILGGVLGTRKK
eukprot:m51a1_g14242 Plasma Membrane Syntaxin A (324) ;mRNA; r:240211-242056